MFGLGSTEIIVVLLIVLVMFGGSKLPQLGSGLGKAIKNFKKGLNEGQSDSTDKIEDKE